MNSHQRRKAARYWKYRFELIPRTTEECVSLLAWCNEQFGSMSRDRWHCRYFSYFPTELIFWFHNEKDAAWFKLTWL